MVSWRDTAGRLSRRHPNNSMIVVMMVFFPLLPFCRLEDQSEQKAPSLLCQTAAAKHTTEQHAKRGTQEKGKL